MTRLRLSDVRSWWTGSTDDDDLLVFAGVATAFTLALLAAGRLLGGVITGRARAGPTP